MLGSPGGANGEQPACQCRRRKRGVWSLGREDPLEKEIATHSSTLAWKSPWTEEPGGLQFMGLKRIGHDWLNGHLKTHTHTHTPPRYYFSHFTDEETEEVQLGKVTYSRKHSRKIRIRPWQSKSQAPSYFSVMHTHTHTHTHTNLRLA